MCRRMLPEMVFFQELAGLETADRFRSVLRRKGAGHVTWEQSGENHEFFKVLSRYDRLK